MDNHNKSAFKLQPIQKMKHSPMLLMSITRLIKGFSSLINGPSFKPAIIVGIKDTYIQTAGSILLRKQMLLFPLWARSACLGQPLPSTSIVMRNCRRIMNSRLFSLHYQPSPLNILLTHSLRPVRLQPAMMTTTILKVAQKMRMTSTLFWEWWKL